MISLPLNSQQKKEINNSNRQARSKQKSIALLESERSRDVARTDMSINLSNLFQAGKFDSECRTVTALPVQQWQGGSVHIKAPQLDSHDQDILFAVLAIALKKYGYYNNISEQDDNDLLQSGGAAKGLTTLKVECTTGDILNMIGGGKGGLQRKKLKISLDWLSMVSVRLENQGGAWASSKLIYAHAADMQGNMVIQLNWRLSAVLLRSGIVNGGGYIPISWQERRSLSAGIPRLMHTICCTRYPGSRDTSKLSEKELTQRIFRDYDNSTARAKKRYRQQIRDAVAEIKQLPGWK